MISDPRSIVTEMVMPTSISGFEVHGFQQK